MPHETNAPKIPFAANDKCIGCGKCAADCVASIIAIENNLAVVAPEDREDCIGCQHCLAICPTSAASVDGLNPADSRPLTRYNLNALDLLIRGRRSVRQFSRQPVARELLHAILETVSHAPAGANIRQRRFTVILEEEVLADFRDRACRALTAGADRLPKNLSWLAAAAGKWLEKGRDVIFRNAPHLIVCSAGPDAATPTADCIIALSHFDLFATANGIGTVWCGMVEHTLRHFPESRAWLGIPEDHAVGYAMLFGTPAVVYARTAQYKTEDVRYVDSLIGA